MRIEPGSVPVGGRVLPMHVDELMGARVLLINSAYEIEQDDGERGVLVPELDDLRVAVAVARALVPAKLTGREIRFMRKAIPKKAADMARFLDVTSETMSRWENDRECINLNAERIFRLKVLTDLRERAPGVEVDLYAAVDLRPSPVRVATGPVTLTFARVNRVIEGRRETMWLYQGIAEEQDGEVLQGPIVLTA